MNKKQEELSERQKTAILLLVNAPQLRNADVASKVGVAEKTLYRWKEDERFSEALEAARVKLEESIADLLTGHLRSLLGMSVAAYSKELQRNDEVQDAMAVIAKDITLPLADRVEAGKAVKVSKVLEPILKGWTDTQLAGPGPGRPSGSSLATFADPDIDPARPTSPQPRPGVDKELSQSSRENIRRVFQAYTTIREVEQVAEQSPEQTVEPSAPTPVDDPLVNSSSSPSLPSPESLP